MKNCTLFSWKTLALCFAALLLLTLGLGCSGSEATGKEGKGIKEEGSDREEKGNRKRDSDKEDRTVYVRAAAFSPDGRLLVVSFGARSGSAEFPEQRQMKLWDVESGKELHTFPLEESANSVFFFAGGKKIVSSTWGYIEVWDVAKRTRDGKYLKGGQPLGIMPDGKKLLVFTDTIQQDRALELWDLFSGELFRKFPGETDPRSLAAISSDGKWALVPTIRHATKFGKIDPATLQLWDLSKGKVKLSFGPENRMFGPVSFSPNSKLAVAQRAAYKEDGTSDLSSLVLWEVPNGKVVRVWKRFPQSLVGFSPDGKELVAVDGFDLRRLFVETGKILWSISLPNKKERDIFVLSPDGSRLFSGGGASKYDLRYLRLEIWDAVQGKRIHKLAPKGP